VEGKVQVRGEEDGEGCWQPRPLSCRAAGSHGLCRAGLLAATASVVQGCGVAPQGGLDRRRLAPCSCCVVEGQDLVERLYFRSRCFGDEFKRPRVLPCLLAKLSLYVLLQ
jgi:hypothetical protein